MSRRLRLSVETSCSLIRRVPMTPDIPYDDELDHSRIRQGALLHPVSRVRVRETTLSGPRTREQAVQAAYESYIMSAAGA